MEAKRVTAFRKVWEHLGPTVQLKPTWPCTGRNECALEEATASQDGGEDEDDYKIDSTLPPLQASTISVFFFFF